MVFSVHLIELGVMCIWLTSHWHHIWQLECQWSFMPSLKELCRLHIRRTMLTLAI